MVDKRGVSVTQEERQIYLQPDMTVNKAASMLGLTPAQVRSRSWRPRMHAGMPRLVAGPKIPTPPVVEPAPEVVDAVLTVRPRTRREGIEVHINIGKTATITVTIPGFEPGAFYLVRKD